MALHLERQGIRVDLVLCSTAARARQTLDLVAPALGKKPIMGDPDRAVFGLRPT
jgi:phosphohistidine phosphatase SixA